MNMDREASILILSAGLLGLLFALYQFYLVSRIQVKGPEHLTAHEKIYKIYRQIQTGARAFLLAEYSLCAVFIVLFGLLILFLTAHASGWTVGIYTALSFVIGALTSILSGYIGMSVAVFANARTTIAAQNPGSDGWTLSFNTAFRAGAVMGFALVSLASLVLYLLILSLSASKWDFTSPDVTTNMEHAKILFEVIAGYGLGGSSIALFGRVGGGIYTKAADVGADLAGKIVVGIPEDDPRNPATIADNVGDNVGDVAGMGSDLFGSFAEATCASLIIASSSSDLVQAGLGAMLFPLLISSTGILASCVTTFMATTISPVKRESDIEKVLKMQLFISTLLLTALVYPLAQMFLPARFTIENTSMTPFGAFVCVSAGLWGGCFIGFVTEYFTSHSYAPVRELADACKTGASTNIIYGLALGYKSVIIPVVLIAASVYVSFSLGEMYGVALAALGMLGTLPICLTIDVYGPVCDNAGGIAEMAELSHEVRDKTDALDAAGNTTAAIGKGFAIGSAALVSLALFGGFITRIGISGLNILRPITFAFLFAGAMLPYWFTAMTMKSVGVAAMEMVNEVVRQFQEIPGLLDGKVDPDHEKCIKISTDASLREMVLPGLLVMLSPIVTGVVFGVEATSGLLTGALVSGVQLAISQSNTGGAWDNAKKYVEKGCVYKENAEGHSEIQGKGSDTHKAAVIGDTVGDPLKDTSGPALNILMKLMAIISLVFADFFMAINHGRGLLDVPSKVL